MFYHYDLHCHTKDGSVCSSLTDEQIVNLYHGLGYDGFCVTNHFTGSTTVPDGTPWEERIDRFYESYERVCRAAKGTGMTIFFGLEYSLLYTDYHQMKKVRGNDFLMFGLTKQWLKEHETLFTSDACALFDAVHEAGGFIIHAHPFAQANYIPNIQLFPDKVDAVEVLNGGCGDAANRRALWYAQSFDLPMTASSDSHHHDMPIYYGVQTDRKCETIQDLIDEIRNRRVSLFQGDVAHALGR